jgi:2'-hydroxyisoflavone reductase
MKVLLLGGSRFVGWHIAAALLKAGHELTLFNRGQTRSGEHDDRVRVIRGDRRVSLDALKGERFDCVIDACGYIPSEVKRSTEALEHSVERYIYVSTISVYADFSKPNSEDAPMGSIEDRDTEVIDARTYGPLKAFCEAELLKVFGQRACILRPGVVIGREDYTQRFTYWLAAHACKVPRLIAPGSPTDPMQWIDARDLADFTVHCLSNHYGGALNVVTDPHAFTSADVMAECASLTGHCPSLAWPSEAELEKLSLKPWQDLPMWMPPSGERAGMLLTPNAAARKHGLQTRGLRDSLLDLYDYWHALPQDAQRNPAAGLAFDKIDPLFARLSNITSSTTL